VNELDEPSRAQGELTPSFWLGCSLDPRRPRMTAFLSTSGIALIRSFSPDWSVAVRTSSYVAAGGEISRRGEERGQLERGSASQPKGGEEIRQPQTGEGLGLGHNLATREIDGSCQGYRQDTARAARLGGVAMGRASRRGEATDETAPARDSTSLANPHLAGSGYRDSTEYTLDMTIIYWPSLGPARDRLEG
jgi:hypothetical protein